MSPSMGCVRAAQAELLHVLRLQTLLPGLVAQHFEGCEAIHTVPWRLKVGMSFACRVARKRRRSMKGTFTALPLIAKAPA